MTASTLLCACTQECACCLHLTSFTKAKSFTYNRPAALTQILSTPVSQHKGCLLSPTSSPPTSDYVALEDKPYWGHLKSAWTKPSKIQLWLDWNIGWCRLWPLSTSVELIYLKMQQSVLCTFTTVPCCNRKDGILLQLAPDPGLEALRTTSWPLPAMTVVWPTGWEGL